MIRDAFEWIIDHIMELWPIGVLDEYQSGLRMRNGRAREVLGPGLYYRIPFIDRVIEIDVAVRTVSVAPVAITTADGVPVNIGANMRWSIVDVRKYVTKLHDPESTLLNEAESVIARVGMDATWEELREGLADVSRHVHERLNEVNGEWGVRVNH